MFTEDIVLLIKQKLGAIEMWTKQKLGAIEM
jgi:hypothetical protein